jgi:hypothetical protein
MDIEETSREIIIERIGVDAYHHMIFRTSDEPIELRKRPDGVWELPK